MTNPTGSGTDAGQGQPQGQPEGQNPATPNNMPGAQGGGGQPQGQQGQQQGQQDAPDSTDPKELQKQLAHWKAMSRKNEDRANASQSKAQEFDKLQDANKSELQKAQDNEARANARAADADAKTARLLAAATHELDPDLVDYLGAGTAEEINDRADTLARIINEQVEKRLEAARNGQQPNGQSAQPANGRPAESLRPGAAPAPGAARATDANSAFRQMLNTARGQ